MEMKPTYMMVIVSTYIKWKWTYAFEDWINWLRIKLDVIRINENRDNKWLVHIMDTFNRKRAQSWIW